MEKTVITLNEQEVLELNAILLDDDGKMRAMPVRKTTEAF